MNTRKKNFYLMAFLAVIAGSCAFLRTPSSGTQTETISAQVNSTPVKSPLFTTTTDPIQIAAVEFWESPVDLQEYFDPENPPRELVNNDYEGQGELSIRVIYALDKEHIFFGGSIFFPRRGDAERSVLLRSIDGGKHWKEVMQTTRVSTVEHIAFLDQGQGWALVAGTGELGASMPVMLWHTTDFGETWKIAGKVFTRTGTSYGRLTLRFYSPTNGEISLICGGVGMCKDGDYYSILSTQDGGVTWQESYHLSLPFDEADPGKEKRLVAFMLPDGGRYGSHAGECYHLQECPSYGQDGSEWQAEYSQDRATLFIRGRLYLENQWTTYELPTCIKYGQGKMIKLCDDSH